MWEPKTYAGARSAADNGLLQDSSGMELKEAITNQKPARSVASLAIDGGTLLIGVSDDGQPKPIYLDGWTEKVAQVAAMKPDPGIRLRGCGRFRPTKTP